MLPNKLLAAGALDVFTIPIQMKKARPGHLLQVLASPDAVDRLTQVIFRETTTIGIRRYPVERSVLDREFVDVDTEFGKVKIKVSRMNGEVMNAAPEYEDCARIAHEKNVPLKIGAITCDEGLSRALSFDGQASSRTCYTNCLCLTFFHHDAALLRECASALWRSLHHVRGRHDRSLQAHDGLRCETAFRHR